MVVSVNKLENQLNNKERATSFVQFCVLSLQPTIVVISAMD